MMVCGVVSMQKHTENIYHQYFLNLLVEFLHFNESGELVYDDAVASFTFTDLIVNLLTFHAFI